MYFLRIKTSFFSLLVCLRGLLPISTQKATSAIYDTKVIRRDQIKLACSAYFLFVLSSKKTTCVHKVHMNSCFHLPRSRLISKWRMAHSLLSAVVFFQLTKGTTNSILRWSEYDHAMSFCDAYMEANIWDSVVPSQRCWWQVVFHPTCQPSPPHGLSGFFLLTCDLIQFLLVKYPAIDSLVYRRILLSRVWVCVCCGCGWV